ncbi:vitamin B12 transporter BtuB [bacterium BMS3Abin05]|nr:vitamin B12 transporter BtuB [bacterium BMS3Abin05]GBE27645.1 vitamin B12 transporter BtuB [bacterium BMS3Bbin03]HDL78415.1 TonB-dependent receptor [Bacteroidota bacterium]HDZ11982.1 TonB-dependent receptor [Bacteroidota bacterium]
MMTYRPISGMALLFLVVGAWVFPVYAQQIGTIKGIVLDMSTGKRIVGVLVHVQNTPASTITDKKGAFRLSKIPAGTYTLEFIKMGYRTLILPEQHVLAEKTTPVIAQLNASTGEKEDVFYIGEIRVEADEAKLPNDPVSKDVVKSGDIENLQASSLGDVLELIPGVEKTNRLGLGKKIQAGIRGRSQDALSTFGTKVILDDAPLSNNANFQGITNIFLGKNVSLTTGQGIDLRNIPADNIETVEVIKGVPSVRYGDFTEGIIKVETKIGKRQPRLTIKHNPDTKEINFGNGIVRWNTGLTYDLNYGYSERNLRKIGDEYHRFTGTLVTRKRFFGRKLTVKHKLFGQRLLDEEKPTDVHRNKRYNRGYTINNDLWGDYVINPLSKFTYSHYVHFRKQNTFAQRLVEADPRSYIGSMRVLGNEWNIGGRWEFHLMRLTGASVFHELIFGTDVEYDRNRGKGVIIDSTRNYYGPLSGKRSYNFDQIPGQTLVGLYAEDKITLHYLRDFTWTLGVRYDLFNPKSIHFPGLWTREPFIKSQQGTFLSPRVGLIVFLSKNSRLRFGYGLSAKSPPLTNVYRAPQVLAFRDITYRHSQKNPDLKGYQLKKLDVGIDAKFFNFARTSLEGYYTYRTGQMSQVKYPFGYVMNPDTITEATYSIYENRGWTRRYGMELSIQTITYKNISFLLNLTHRSEKMGRTGLFYYSHTDTAKGQRPWAPAGMSWRKKAILDVRLSYKARSLGIWVSVWMQSVVYEKFQQYTVNSFYWWENNSFSYPPKTIYNFAVSKSLWKGAEVSFYINNFFDDRNVYRHPYFHTYSERTSGIFYGFKLSTKL